MKKTLSIIRVALTWFLVIFTAIVLIFTIVSVTMFDRTDRNLFGYRFLVVSSDSMSATDFDAGDLVIIKKVKDPSSLKEGDIISFQSTSDQNRGAIVTHKIRRLTQDEHGNPGFITYGTTTNTDDSEVVTYSFVLGKYQGKLHGVGNFFRFFKTVPGYLVCIVLPFGILMLAEGIQLTVYYIRFSKERKKELEDERARAEEERKENEAMRAKMLAMEAALLQHGIEAPAEEVSQSPAEEN